MPKRALWLSVNILLALALALAGCSRSGQPETPRFQGTLTVLYAPGLAGQPFRGPDATWLQDAARAYEEAHPGIRVQLVAKSSATEVEELLRSGGVQADLIFGRYLPEAASRLAEVGALVPKDSLAANLPGAVSAFQGRGLPMLVDAQVLALNVKTFQSAGVALPKEGRWTLAEFEDHLKGLSTSNHSALGFFCLPGYHEWWPFAGGVVQADLTVAPDLQAGLARLQEYRSRGWLHPDTAKVGPEAMWGLFASGSGPAVLPVSTWALPLLKAPPYQVDLAVAGFPDGLTTGYVYGMMISAQTDSARARAAADLALALASPANQARLARETGLLPASTKAPNPFAGDSLMAPVPGLVTKVLPLPTAAAWGQAEPQLARGLVLALVGGETPAAATANIKAILTKATAPGN